MLTFAGVASAQEEAPAWSRDYVKHEALVPMRDGVRLHTSILAPKDATGRHPVLLHRTPYSCAPYGEERFPEVVYPDPLLTREGYIFVCQDVRGTYMSEGTWVHMRPHLPRKSPGETDESTDAYDTIDWLLRNVPNHNGRVGIWGASYPGFYAAASMIEAHPALKCALVQAPQVDWWYEDVHHNGAFFLAPVFHFVEELGLPRDGPTTRHPSFGLDIRTPDGFEFFLTAVGPLHNVNDEFFHERAPMWNAVVRHPNRDAFWQMRDLRPHLRNVAPAVMHVGGWFDDSNLFGTLEAYRAIEAQAPDTFNVLVIGPWEHTGWEWNAEGEGHGDVDFGQPTARFYRREAQEPFLRLCLLGGSDAFEQTNLPEALVFETGANRWREFDAWPPRELEQRHLYLEDEGKLSWEPPTTTGFDAFVSDPAKPVPHTEEILPGRSRRFMNADQRFAARRPDVLVYRTEPLREPLTIAGPLTADLWVSTDRGDADWIVKLIDEHPGEHPDWPRMRPESRAGGYQMLVRAEVMRGRFRNDPAHPEPFEPNVPTRVRFRLLDVLHTFRQGHRLMVQIQSTWFPLVDRNPQAWVDNIFEAKDSDFLPATHRLHREVSHPSRLRVGVLQSTDGRFQQDLAWSPDGRDIAFSQYHSRGEAPEVSRWNIYASRADLPSERLVVRDARSPSWSPDGDRIAFSAERDGNWDIYSIAVDGSDLRRVTFHQSDDRQPSWSPSGRSIAFCSNRRGYVDIYVVRADGTGLTRLTEDPGSDYGPAWSPDGRELVFYREKGDGMDQIYVAQADGSGVRRLTHDEANNTFPSFLPDGRVAFSSTTARGATKLVVTRADGSAGVVVGVPGLSPFLARWSPDGSRVAFIAGKWPRSSIYTMSAGGTEIRRLIN